jgi:hypothetical protein
MNHLNTIYPLSIIPDVLFSIIFTRYLKIAPYSSNVYTALL